MAHWELNIQQIDIVFLLESQIIRKHSYERVNSEKKT